MLVDGDPTQDIEDVRKVAAVITRGFLIYPREIDATLGIAPFVGEAPQVIKTATPVAGIYSGGNDGARARIDATARKRD